MSITDHVYTRSDKKSPTVLATAKHSIKGGKAAAECSGISSWIEFITPSRVCEGTVHPSFDPLTASYAVLSGTGTADRSPNQYNNSLSTIHFPPLISKIVCEEDWAYFNGYCYRKVSSCGSWTNSVRYMRNPGS
ncbi:uncharacterized protein LOC111342345 [Stylophora pistillata]|uniref:uncharacterized protein LOC111342345 n=1 Tax=Stylophora pistillata TaxID=50429 RepID=UPI000C04516D|nr:uncharacterized protein LOC111342345 [Stylophora pistillata]